MYVLFNFFFFKQKTAYEMRISDWSSDVCSSDLWPFSRQNRLWGPLARRGSSLRTASSAARHEPALHQPFPERYGYGCYNRALPHYSRAERPLCDFLFLQAGFAASGNSRRSEEHTSELQSLMRISYAVFCLKKKK